MEAVKPRVPQGRRSFIESPAGWAHNSPSLQQRVDRSRKARSSKQEHPIQVAVLWRTAALPVLACRAKVVHTGSAQRASSVAAGQNGSTNAEALFPAVRCSDLFGTFVVLFIPRPARTVEPQLFLGKKMAARSGRCAQAWNGSAPAPLLATALFGD